VLAWEHGGCRAVPGIPARVLLAFDRQRARRRRILELLIERAGDDKAVRGSHSPFVIGPADPREIPQGLCPGLRARITSDNARAFLSS
jgi:hypothetical protein